MGYFDDVKSMFGRGMDAADRKTQELRLQAELTRIGSSLESAYAALGKVVYAHPTLASLVQQDVPGEYKGVTSLLEEERSIRSRIEELRRQAAAAAQPKPQPLVQFACTKCGTPVSLDYLYCPSCGDNLAELKRQHRLCPNCGIYLGPDSLFCLECGTRTIELPIAQPRQLDARAEIERPTYVVTDSEEGATADHSQEDVIPTIEVGHEEAQTPEENESEMREAKSTCPNCGASIPSGNQFCEECGTRVVG